MPTSSQKVDECEPLSVGGNTKTVMVANLGPADYNLEETMAGR